MQWIDDGIVLGTRNHGESSVVLELFTREHGRHLGLVRGGRSRRLQPLLQPGNSVHATWNARLDEHLGAFVVEGTVSRAARLMESRIGLAGLTHLATLARLMPEREPHQGLYEAILMIADALPDATIAAPLMVRFELEVLQDLGFGLDLTECAATGVTDDLIYVSPKSGRAVCREAGAPWADKLFRLPLFLTGSGPVTSGDVADAFELTGYFLDQRIFEPRGIALGDARRTFSQLVGLDKSR